MTGNYSFGIIFLLLNSCGTLAPQLTVEELRSSVPSPEGLAWNEGDSILFAVYGDNRLSGNHQDRNIDSVRRKRRRAIVDAISSVGPDFVIHTGDLVERGSNSELWSGFVQDSKDLLKPRFFYPVVGNHEYKGGNSESYFGLFRETIGNSKSYSFKIGPATFIFLDSVSNPSPGMGPNSNIHSAWFNERLVEALDSRFLFVVMHHPVFSSGRGQAARWILGLKCGHAPRTKEKRLRAILADNLRRRRLKDPNAGTTVFTGHSHFYESYVFSDVNFIVTGGGGAPWHMPSANPPPFRTAAYRGDHFLRVSVMENKVEVQVQPVGDGKWIQN